MSSSAEAAPLSVDALIRRRVLSRDSELTPILARWRAYVAAASSAATDAAASSASAEEAYQALLQAVDALHFSVARQAAVHAAVDVELSSCDRAAADTRGVTLSLKADIASLRLELARASGARQHRQQVDALAAQCNRLASRADTALLLAALQSDIAALEAEQTAMAAETDSRRRQFGLIALALDTVSAQWRQPHSSSDGGGSSHSDAMAVG